jgi:hypothetical protein
MRLLTTAAALALFAASVAPGLAIAAGETPTSSGGATTGTSTSTSTGGSLSEPAGVDSNATTPSVYAPSSGTGSPGAGAGSAGTGGGVVSPSGTSASGPLGNSTSPALAPGGSPSSSSGALAPAAGSATNLLPGTTTGTLSSGSIGVGSATIVGAPSAKVPYAASTGPIVLPPSPGTGYVGAGHETSVLATEHYRMSARSDGAMDGASRYEALAREMREAAGDTGMADRNGSWAEDLGRETELRIEPRSTFIAGDRGGK